MSHRAAALPLDKPRWLQHVRHRNNVPVSSPSPLHPFVEHANVGRNQASSSACAALRRPSHHPYRVRAPKAAALDEEKAQASEEAESVSAVQSKIGPSVARFVVPEFYTRKGQRLAIVGSAPQLGAWNGDRALEMTHEGNNRWTADLPIEPGWRGAVEFKVVLIDERGPTFEDGSNRLFLVDGSGVGDIITIECAWGSTTSAPHLPAPLSSGDEDQDKPVGQLSDCTVYVPSSPGCSSSCVDEMRLVGGLPQLGSWNPDQGAELSLNASGVWSTNVKLPACKLVEAKIVVRKTSQPWRWESGLNRTLLLVDDNASCVSQSGAKSASKDESAPVFAASSSEAASQASAHTFSATPAPESSAPKSKIYSDKGQTSSSSTDAAAVREGAAMPHASSASARSDYAVILHLGVTSYSQVVFQGAVDPRYWGCASLTAAECKVTFTVPCFPTQPGQHLVVVGDDPSLGSWDPAKGLRLGWECGNKWSASVQLPLKPVEAKLVLVHGDQHTWEPSSRSPEQSSLSPVTSGETNATASPINPSSPSPSEAAESAVSVTAVAPAGSRNRVLDLGTLVMAGSPTGAGDIHLAMHWGETLETPAMVIPKAPPALVVEARLDDEDESRRREQVVAGPTTVILQGSAADHAKDEVLINLLSFLASGSMLVPEASVAEVAAAEEVAALTKRIDELTRELEQQTSSLSTELAKAQSDVGAAAERERKLRKSLNEAINEAGSAKKAMQELSGSQRSVLEEASQRHQAHMAEARSSYESRILDIQRGYEARILGLQDHESRILELQHKHSSTLDEIEARHKKQVSTLESMLERCTKEYTQKLDVLQSQARAAALALQEQARQHESEQWAMQKEMKEAAAAHETDITRLTEQAHAEARALKATHSEREAQLQAEIEVMVAQHKSQLISIEADHAEERNLLQRELRELAAAHASEMSTLQESMDEKTAAEQDMWKTKMAEVESRAAAAAEAALLRESLLQKEMDRLVSQLERRSIFLAQLLAKKEADNEVLRRRLYASETKLRTARLAALEKMMDQDHPGSSEMTVHSDLDLDMDLDPALGARMIGSHRPNGRQVQMKQPHPSFVTATHIHGGSGSSNGSSNSGSSSAAVNPVHPAAAAAAAFGAHDMDASSFAEEEDAWVPPSGEGSAVQLAGAGRDSNCVPVYGNNILAMGGPAVMGFGGNGLPSDSSSTSRDIGSLNLREVAGLDCEWLTAPLPGLMPGNHHFSLSAFVLAAWLSVLQQSLPGQSQM